MSHSDVCVHLAPNGGIYKITSTMKQFQAHKPSPEILNAFSL